MGIDSIRDLIIARRRAARMTQAALAARAHVSLPTLKALEQGRMTELGFSKVARLLAALGLELEVREANRGRPTLDTLRNEAGND